MADKALTQLRDEIDALDKQLHWLIASRAELAAEVAKVKKASGKAQIFYRPEREAQVLRAVIDRNESLLKDKDIAHIFREIMSACLALEQGLKIAYLGPEGTFTQEATLKHFGHAVSTLDCPGIDEVFLAVEKNNADYGVVPIENSSNGAIGATIDLLYLQNLNICGEVEIAVHHQLMMKDKANEICKIYAHQQALDQCRHYLETYQSKAELCPVASNALAAKLVQDEPNSAAIASNSASILYDLQKVVSNIEDKQGNTTRFLIIGKERTQPSGKDKTSLLALLKHKAGALFDLLKPFKEAQINLVKLNSHPKEGENWQYLFLMDIEGHQQDENVVKVLQQIADESVELKILGSYPQAVL
jgi:chorismate mutase/prephenate dehydratase